MSKALSGWMQTAFRCLVLVTCAMTVKLNSILAYAVLLHRLNNITGGLTLHSSAMTQVS